jgi:hypothetical protein
MKRLSSLPSIFCAVAAARMLGRLMSIGVLVVATSCKSSSSVDRTRCEQLRDHLVDLRLAGAHAATERQPTLQGAAGAGEAPTPAQRPLTRAELAAHRRVLAQALGDGLVASCEKTMSAQQLDCALAATDPAAAAACTN